MKAAGVPAASAQGAGRRRRPARAATPRRRRRPRAVRLQAAGRARRDAARQERGPRGRPQRAGRRAARQGAEVSAEASTPMSSETVVRPLHHRRRQRRRARRRAWRRSAARASRSPRTRPLGGTCVNLGCIPKKLYSFAAHYAEASRRRTASAGRVAAPTLRLGDAEGQPRRRDHAPQRRLRRAPRPAPA